MANRFPLRRKMLPAGGACPLAIYRDGYGGLLRTHANCAPIRRPTATDKTLFNPLAHGPVCGYISTDNGERAAQEQSPAQRCQHEKKTSWGKREYQMNNSTKILYE